MSKASEKKTALIAWYEKLPNNLKGAFISMFAALGFAIMVAGVKWMGQTYHVTQILMIRQIVMVSFVIQQFSSNPLEALKTNQLGLQITRVLAALIAMTCGFTAIIHMDLATATAIGFSKSFFMTIFAIFILGEVVGIRRWSAVIIGFLGVFVMLQPTIDGISFYEILSIVGAAGAALAMVCIRKLTRTEASITILAYQAFFVGIAVSIPAFYFWKWPEVTDWFLLIGIGILAYFSQRLNILSFKYAETSLLAILDYVRIIYATLFGIFLFNQYPSIYTVIGAVIIVLTAAYTVYRELKKKKKLDIAPVRTGV